MGLKDFVEGHPLGYAVCVAVPAILLTIALSEYFRVSPLKETRLEPLSDKVSDLEGHLSKSESSRETLQQEKSNLKTYYEDKIEQINEDLRSKQEELAERKVAGQDSLRRVDELEKENARLKPLDGALQNERERIRQLATLLREATKSLALKGSTSNQSCDECFAALQSATQEIGRLERSIESLEQTVESRNKDVEGLELRRDTYEAALRCFGVPFPSQKGTLREYLLSERGEKAMLDAYPSIGGILGPKKMSGLGKDALSEFLGKNNELERYEEERDREIRKSSAFRGSIRLPKGLD